MTPVDRICASRVAIVGVELVWSRAIEAEQDGWQGAVPASGRGERSVQVDTYRGDLAEQALGGEVIGEACRGAHRSHGVRAGRADPHAEQVEHADRHDPSSGIADRDGGGARRTRVHDRPHGYVGTTMGETCSYVKAGRRSSACHPMTVEQLDGRDQLTCGRRSSC
jgi:hypothetical protein